MKRLLQILGILLAGFILIQLVPYGRDHTNPAVVAEPKWDSPQTRELAKRACFDCHSNETVWPWYSNVAPASWLVERDVVEGRHEVNFSEWSAASGGRERKSGQKLGKVVTEGEMPPVQYTLIHSEAILSQAERQQLVMGFLATFGN
jgi:mono/diheme cytochrome c family protein